MRLSPVVAAELLRGSRGRARRAIERLVARMVPIEPPSWRERFCESGRLLPRIFAHHEAAAKSWESLRPVELDGQAPSFDAELRRVA